MFPVMLFGGLLNSAHGAEKPNDDENQPIVLAYDHSPGAVIVEMSCGSPWSRQVEPPLLQIFGDGTVVVTHPSYSNHRGTFESRLSDEEMQDLLQHLERLGLLRFDEDKVKQQASMIFNQRQDEAAAAGQPFQHRAILDGSNVSIQINLTRYKAKGARVIRANPSFKAS